MEKTFQRNFQEASNDNARQIKETIVVLGKDKLDSVKPKLLKNYQLEKVAIENNEAKFEKTVEIIRLDSGHGYGSNSSGRRQFAAVVYKIPIVNGKVSTFQLKPSKYYTDRLVTEEINYDEKNIVFAIGTKNENELLSKETTEEVRNARTRILILVNKNINQLNQDIETYNHNLETLITQEIHKRKQYLDKLDEVVSEL
jgi:hypothetical protein